MEEEQINFKNVKISNIFTHTDPDGSVAHYNPKDIVLYILVWSQQCKKKISGKLIIFTIRILTLIKYFCFVLL